MKSRNDFNHEEYSKIRNNVKKTVRQRDQNEQINIASECKKNPKKFC